MDGRAGLVWLLGCSANVSDADLANFALYGNGIGPEKVYLGLWSFSHVLSNLVLVLHMPGTLLIGQLSPIGHKQAGAGCATVMLAAGSDCARVSCDRDISRFSAPCMSCAFFRSQRPGTLHAPSLTVLHVCCRAWSRRW